MSVALRNGHSPGELSCAVASASHLPDVWLSVGRQCLDIVSYLVEGLRKAEEWGEKLFVSMDMASAFDAVRPELLGDAILSRGAQSSLQLPW